MSLEDLSPESVNELAGLMRQLAEDPSTRKDILKLTKKVRPEMPIPVLEIEESTKRATQSMRDELESMRSQLRDRDALDELKKRRNNLKNKGLVSGDSDIDEVEKLMLEKGITNHEAAAEYWQFMQQAATPTPVSGYNPSAISKFDLSKYWKNPVAGARDEAAKALIDWRKPTRPIGL